MIEREREREREGEKGGDFNSAMPPECSSVYIDQFQILVRFL